MNPERFLIKARAEDELRQALEGAIVIEGAAGGTSGAAGDVARGLVIVGADRLAEHMPRLQEIADELAGGDEIRLRLVRAVA